MDEDLKVVVHLKGGHAYIGVQEEGADPVMERVEAGDLDEALGAVPAVLNRARARWAESRRNPAYQGPPPAPRAQAGEGSRAPASRSSRSREPQVTAQQSMF